MRKMPAIIKIPAHITIASLLTLIVYLALYFIWGALLSEEANYSLKMGLLSLLTLIAYAFILMRVVKHNDASENEVLKDYENSPYTTLADDIKTVLFRETLYLICISCVIAAAYLLNKFDSLVFGKKVISIITFPFTPMTIFGVCFNPDIIGYLLSILIINFFYVLFVALYRRKQYRYWKNSK